MKQSRAIDFRFAIMRMENLNWTGQKIFKWIKANRNFYEITQKEMKSFETYYTSQGE